MALSLFPGRSPALFYLSWRGLTQVSWPVALSHVPPSGFVWLCPPDETQVEYFWQECSVDAASSHGIKSGGHMMSGCFTTGEASFDRGQSSSWFCFCGVLEEIRAAHVAGNFMDIGA